MIGTKENALRIPEAARKRHIAILGMNGSGKTSVAKVEIAEPALQGGERVCNIDPTGVGWGLRLMRNGKSPGFKIYIVGGPHGDWPLKDTDGELWAEIVGTSSDSFIFDTSQMTVGRRSAWFKDFAEALVIKNRGPLHFILDEAHLFAPQAGATGGGIAPQMLHATNNLLALGRSKGLRVTMISQRPAKLHKDSLTQAHTLVAMMMVGKPDRDAVRAWIADQADEAKGAEIVASLPSLSPGEGWIWAPRERVLERVKFARPMTFDSSSAPEDLADAGVKLTPIDPSEITGRLAQVAQEQKDNDAGVLRMRVATLTAQVEQLKQMPVNTGDADRSYSDGYAQGTTHGFARGVNAQAKRVMFMTEYARDLLGVIKSIAGTSAAAERSAEAHILKLPEEPQPPEPSSVQQPGPPVRKTIMLTHETVKALKQTPQAIIDGGDTSKIEPAALKLVEALLFWQAVGITNPSREQVAGVSGYAVKSGRFRNLLGALRTAGVVAYPTDGNVTLAAAPDGVRALTMAEARERLASILEPAEYKVARSFLPGIEITREQLARASDYEPTSGRFRNIVGRLRTLNIIVYPSDGLVTHSPWAKELLGYA